MVEIKNIPCDPYGIRGNFLLYFTVESIYLTVLLIHQWYNHFP